MIAEDRQEKERVDARNALEEYVYDLRAKLSEENQLASFITETDKEVLCRTLDDTENWLYEEGEDCQRQVYSERLTRLKVIQQNICQRSDILYFTDIVPTLLFSENISFLKRYLTKLFFVLLVSRRTDKGEKNRIRRPNLCIGRISRSITTG